MTEKSPFGKYAIIGNIRRNFRDEPDLWWEIKPPTTGDELMLTRYINTGKVEYSLDGGVSNEGSPSWLDILFYEVALLFGGTNIPADADSPISEGGKPFIESGSEMAVIEERLRLLPMEMFAEVADMIAECVPGWGPKKPLSRTEESS